MSSTAFGSKRRPAGKAFRTSGNLAAALDDVYKDVDAGFVAVENRLNEVGTDVLVSKGVIVAVFDTAVTANKTVATHAIGPALPAGAVITHAWYKVNTTFQSTAGGADKATIGIGTTSHDEEIVTAVAIETGTPWDAGWHNTTQTGSSANFTTATAAGDTLVAKVGTAALTAGKLTVYAEYIVAP